MRTKMGKLKRQRQKFHVSKNIQPEGKTDSFLQDTASLLPLTSPKENLFAGINVDLINIKKKRLDDVQSVKSYKSLKSEIGRKIISKKEKLKLRREVLLKKVDIVQQMKKELKLREKRKNTSLIGDTNPLHDALPSLESLLKSRSNIKYNVPTQNQNIKKERHRQSYSKKEKARSGCNCF
ncbi:hypothetical protein NQ314_010481 [Rhamnusium bicolor]|uniref:Ribosome biogenesis protein NOP53 n=1 Tax=Rhamnusium bicolor TaxID=1586634 RepID=A0AAV8XQ80_9CUCU|nr:hypothetical protein NQ314_010481 [Rhamnusium bicolor]